MKNSLIGLAIVALIFAGSLTIVESRIVFPKGFPMVNAGGSIVINPTTGNLKDAISQYDEVILEPGVYTGEKNRNITIPDGRNVYVHAINDLNKPIIDAEGFSNIFTVNSSSTLKLDGVTCKNGSSENGGAIESNGSLIIDHCSLENSNASIGGALFATISNLNNFEISNTEFINNNANSMGGSVFVNGFNTSFKIENSVIRDSNAKSGAGICFWSNNLTVTAENINLSNNTALTNDSQQDGIGGGIELYGDFNFNLIKSVIQSNRANLGAGIYASGGSNEKSKMKISNCNIDSNEALNYGEGYTVNSAYGGAGIASIYSDVYLQNNNLTRNNASYSKDLDPDSDELSNNRGGGYYNYNGDVTIDNCRFEDNFAYNGGGLDTRYGTFNITNSVFRDNLATFGGGVYTHEGDLFLENTNLSNNCVNSSLSSSVNASGGGLYNLNGTMHVDSCSVTSNVAAGNGGGLDARYGSYDIRNSLISHNIGKDGAGVYVHFGDVNMISSEVSDNSGEYGAGLCCEDGNLNLLNSNISSNHASLNAAGAYNINGTVNVDGCVFEGNVAGDNGGGLDTRHGNSHVTNSKFIRNSALLGGGFYTRDGELSLSNTELGNNHAVSGGAVYCNKTLNVNNCNVHDNYATDVNDGCGGGAIYSCSGDMSVINSVFNNNSAGADGGAIFSSSDDNILDVNDSIFTNNKGFCGGAIFSWGINVSNSNFTNNAAGRGGGAIFLPGAIPESMRVGNVNKSNFTNNYITEIFDDGGGDGGAIYTQFNLNVFDSNFTNNIGYSAGAIRSDEGYVACTRSTIFKDNKPTDCNIPITWV